MKKISFFYISVRKSFFFIHFFLFYILGTAQVFHKFDDNIILWTADYKLRWEDFQGTPDENHFASAVTNYSIIVRFEYCEDFIKVFVENTFLKKTSWKKYNTSDNLLKHEQGHFDIAEIYARQIRKMITQISYNRLSEFFEKIKYIEKKQGSLLKKEQKKYDYETNLSRDIEAQSKWSKEIEKRLTALNDYNNPVIILKMPKGNLDNISMSEIELLKLINEFIEKDTTIIKTP